MNTSQTQERSYEAILLKGDKRRIVITANNRRAAVTKALNWFWYEFKGSLGPANKVLIVSDPYNEVRYSPRFRCNDRLNKLLSRETTERIITEAQGELEVDARKWKPRHPPSSVKRVKRRRDFGKFIAPCIKKMRCGTMYYRITLVPQMTKSGRTIRKRKHRDIRLKARTLIAAIDEVKTRGLNSINQMRRNMKVRDLTFTAHVSGLITASVLTHEQEKRFSRVRSRYDKTRAA